MSKRVWSNLEFILTDTDTNETLHLGESSKQFNSIAKSNEMFSALMTYSIDEEEGRSIPIVLNLKSMNDTALLNKFLNPSKEYDLKIIKDGANYYSRCIALEPEIENCDDLFGDSQKGITYTINLQLLNSRNYFESDPISSSSVGSTLENHFLLGVSYPSDIDDYVISVYKPLEPVLINNIGGDTLGFELTIKPNSPLVNPVLYNLTTGFSMKILINAKVGDVLIIDTRQKTVSLNGQYYENVKQIQDNWLKLELGYNTIKFDADTGGQDADVVLTYRNKYRGF